MSTAQYGEDFLNFSRSDPYRYFLNGLMYSPLGDAARLAAARNLVDEVKHKRQVIDADVRQNSAKQAVKLFQRVYENSLKDKYASLRFGPSLITGRPAYFMDNADAVKKFQDLSPLASVLARAPDVFTSPRINSGQFGSPHRAAAQLGFISPETANQLTQLDFLNQEPKRKGSGLGRVLGSVLPIAASFIPGLNMIGAGALGLIGSGMSGGNPILGALGGALTAPNLTIGSPNLEAAGLGFGNPLSGEMGQAAIQGGLGALDMLTGGTGGSNIGAAAGGVLQGALSSNPVTNLTPNGQQPGTPDQRTLTGLNNALNYGFGGEHTFY